MENAINQILNVTSAVQDAYLATKKLPEIYTRRINRIEEELLRKDSS